MDAHITGSLLGGSGMAGIGGLRTVRYWEEDGVSGRRLMLRPFSKRIEKWEWSATHKLTVQREARMVSASNLSESR